MNHYFRFPLPNNCYFEEKVTSSTQLLINEAIRNGFRVDIPVGTRLVVITKDGKSAIVQSQTPDLTSYIGYYATEDKGVCKALLHQAGLEVPFGYTLRSGQTQTQFLEVYRSLHHPLVVKPTHGCQGEKVFLKITSEDSYLNAVRECFKAPRAEGAGVIVEQQFDGKEYRVVATRDKVLAIMHRVPANVMGNGKATIAELIEIKNADPRRSDNHTDSLTKIRVDDMVKSILDTHGLSLHSIPKEGEQIFLRQNSNISTGGDSIDATDQAHPSISKLAIRAMRAIPGLAFAGIDFMTTDISKHQNKDMYKIIEINKSPGFDIHEQPYQGKSRPISKELLKLLFS